MLAGLSFALMGCNIEDFKGGDRAQSDFHYNFPLNPGGSVNIDTFNGGIEIIGWYQDTVDVAGTKYASTLELCNTIKIDTKNNDREVTVRAVRPGDSHGNMGTRFVIHVPKKVTLDRVVTSNGKIEVDQIEGAVNLRTSNGHITADHVGGPVSVRTSNGAIHIMADRQLTSDLHAQTSNGAIEVRLPASTLARLRASTSNSGVSCDFDLTIHGQIEKHRMEGTFSGAKSDAPLIDLSTSNGSIRVTKL
jgi:DUF4097 and DUF4098 domain-containing protein YvlB